MGLGMCQWVGGLERKAGVEEGLVGGWVGGRVVWKGDVKLKVKVGGVLNVVDLAAAWAKMLAVGLVVKAPNWKVVGLVVVVVVVEEEEEEKGGVVVKANPVFCCCWLV